MKSYCDCVLFSYKTYKTNIRPLDFDVMKKQPFKCKKKVITVKNFYIKRSQAFYKRESIPQQSALFCFVLICDIH